METESTPQVERELGEWKRPREQSGSLRTPGLTFQLSTEGCPTGEKAYGIFQSDTLFTIISI